MRSDLADSARAVARGARATPTVDPVRETAFLESIVHTWLGDFEEAVSLLGEYLAANPGVSFDPPLSWYWTDLEDSPEIVNEDAYGKGWMIKVKISGDESELADLLSSEQYLELIGE